MPFTPAPFVGRDRELAELTRIGDAPGPALAVLYGRPFVGKSRLLRKKTGSDRFLYVALGNTTPERHRRTLLEALDRRFPETRSDLDDGWKSLLDRLFSIAERRRDGLVVLLDDARSLLSTPVFQNALADKWPADGAGPDLTIVAAATGYRPDDVLGDEENRLRPLLDYTAEIDPLDYIEAGRMTPERSAGQRAYIYGIFGGRPGLLSSIRQGESLGEAARNALVSPEGPIHLRLSTLLERVPSIRDPNPYRSVLLALAAGCTETNETARDAGLGDRKTMARRALETLGELGFVRRRRHFRAGKRAPWQNRIADPAVRFWHRFVLPNRTEIATRGADRVWSERIVDRLDEYMHETFLRIVEQGFERFHNRWDLPAASDWGRWSGADLNRRPVDIDIAAELEDGRILTGLVVWSSEPAQYDIHFRLRQDLEAIKHLGETWAEDALSEETSHGHVYVSAGGFTDYFRNQARTSDGIHLVTLHDLYPDA